ncbi:MAG: septum formation initiator family protein [Candidatus Marinimicrobia bacterium]|nr:septum formation initiator family protein [Candidatus Neomarinimicrobiota bacterium]MBL7010578.1 septum formation initiator family protein [Candidatus Neomarinimicrobiota bacterium]MBL7030793.1 septum formation initiator family protein [Candidatus Neomarinimicrobiota bacterium]
MSFKGKSSRIKRKRVAGSSSVDTQKRIIRAILVMGAVALLILFFFGDHGLYQLYSLKKERAEVQDKINALREEKIVLEGEKTKLQTDYKYIEELAREKYRMAKKGEKVFKVIDKKKEK